MMKTVFKHQFTKSALGVSPYKCEEIDVLADRATTIVLDNSWATVLRKNAPAFDRDWVLDRGMIEPLSYDDMMRNGFRFTLYSSRKHSADEIKTMIKAAIEAHVRKQFAHLLDADLSAVKD